MPVSGGRVQCRRRISQGVVAVWWNRGRLGRCTGDAGPSGASLRLLERRIECFTKRLVGGGVLIRTVNFEKVRVGALYRLLVIGRRDAEDIPEAHLPFSLDRSDALSHPMDGGAVGEGLSSEGDSADDRSAALLNYGKLGLAMGPNSLTLLGPRQSSFPAAARASFSAIMAFNCSGDSRTMSSF